MSGGTGGNGSTGGGSAGGTAAVGGGNAQTGGGQGGGQSGTEICDDKIDNDGDTFTDCADTDCFQNVACFASCTDLCTDSAAICDGAGVRTCEMDTSTGCRKFGAIVACTGGLLCSGGTCVTTCSNQCTAGDKQCSNTGGVVTCQTLASGCTDWVGPMMCMNGDVCSGGACVPASQCTNQCTAGATRCTTGGQIQTCVTQTGGCTDWSFPLACTGGQTCAAPATSCAPVLKCTAGTNRCGTGAAPTVETCDAVGNWVVSQSCPQACSMGQCTASATCTAGNVRCNGQNVEVCNSTGSAWLFSQQCLSACSSGVCADPCMSGTKRCNGKVPETCNAAGNAWTPATACTLDCYQGDCIQADLIIDGVTQTLEGDLRFQNSVIVRNGGQLKVGPTGQLRLKAKTISIDAASNVNANGVGDGSLPVTTISVYSHCANETSNICCNSADHRDTSVTCIGNLMPASCIYTQNPCAGQPAIVPSRNDDTFVAEGGKVGSQLGGGLVRFEAEQITVDGQITANGVGSAFGGGILLAADTIQGAGAIQATGGQPGYVKMLRGSTNTFSGSVSTPNVKSTMPPLDIVSGSHPDQNRWYNDGIGDLFVAWSKPFPTLNGYYFKLSNTVDTLPSQAANNGTFLMSESFQVPFAQLQAGANFFHIVAVDSTFNVGTVKGYFKMNLNRTPPTISSASHPSQTTWYQNPAVYLTWTNPQPDVNFTGYYYAFDKFADTLPTATMPNYIANAQILRSNVADGIWYFHLVNRDSRGAVTKAAAHYQVRVGTEPMKENLSGSVFDGSAANAPLTGVTIQINRGVFSATTVANGTYTFNGNLYVGQWEVTAKKAGYVSQTKMITLTSGMPLNENFTLVREP